MFKLVFNLNSVPIAHCVNIQYFTISSLCGDFVGGGGGNCQYNLQDREKLPKILLGMDIKIKYFVSSCLI